METWYGIHLGRLGLHGNPITRHQYVSSTAHFLVCHNGGDRKDEKFTDWREFHPTWEAARDRLLELHEPAYLKALANLEENKRLAVEQVEKNLAERKANVDFIKALQPPKETGS